VRSTIGAIPPTWSNDTKISKQLPFHLDGDRLGLAPVSLAPFNLLHCPVRMLGSIID